MPDRHPADAPSGQVGLDLVDALLGDIAGVLHDRPVQSIVAAGLMLQSVTPPEDQRAMAERGLGALDRAGQLSRDLMWALDRRAPHGGLRASLLEGLDRAGHPEDGLTVEVPDPVPPTTAELLYAVIVDVVVDVALTGGWVRSVRVEVADGHVTAEVVTSPGRAAGSAGPWLRLATGRLSGHGGDLMLDEGPDARTVRMRLPR